MKKYMCTQKAKWLLTIVIVSFLWILPQEVKASYATYPTGYNEYKWDFAGEYVFLQLNFSDEEDNSPDGGLNSNTKIKLYYMDGSTERVITEFYFWAPSNGGSKYKIKRIQGGDFIYNDGSSTWKTCNVSNTDFEASRYSSWKSGDHRVYYAQFKIEIPAEYYGKTIKFSMSGTDAWGRNGPPGDVNININENITITSLQTPTITKKDSAISTTRPALRFNWTTSDYNSSRDGKGKMYLYEKTGSGTFTQVGTNKSPASSGFFNREIDAAYFNSEHQYYVQNQYGTNHTKTSNTIEVPAYPQATGFSAAYSETNREVTLTWNIQTMLSGNFIQNDYFEIQRSTSPSFTSPTTITTSLTTETNYAGNKNSYTFVDKSFKDMSVNTTYYYRIRRTGMKDSWTWTYFVSTANTKVNTQHIDLTSVEAKLDTANNAKAIVTWKCSGSLWLSGSKLVIKRVNLATGREDDIYTANDSTRAVVGKYIDDVTACNKYNYKLVITPANTNYRLSDVKTTNVIAPTEIGKLVSFSADKGYSPDKVVLDWTTDGTFDEFVIKRKVYGEHDSTYLQIKSVQGSTVSTVYQSEDMQGDPGVIYVYSLVGLVSCLDSAFTSAEVLTDIGFRRPVGIATGRVTYGTGAAVQGVKVYAETLNPDDEVNAYRALSIPAAGNMTISNAQKMIDTTGFTFQAWVRSATKTSSSIFTVDTSVSLGYTATTNNLQFKVGSNTLVVLDTFSVANKYNQYSVSVSDTTMAIYINGKLVAKKAISLSSFTVNAQNLVIGGTGFAGDVDDIRIWKGCLDSLTITENICRYLTGNEAGLRAYWRFEESVANTVYDMSCRGTRSYNKNDATITGSCSIIDAVPEKAQLTVMGVTDTNGNYVINAIPYSGTGTNYKFIPMFDVHEFNPTNQLRMIGNTKAVQDGVDFEDVSSFKVTVKVYYEETSNSFGVEGVSFAVDGQTCIKDGKQIITGSNGEAIISVPIGNHSVTAHLNGHEFAQRGYFPFDAEDTTKKFDFQAPRNIEFIDTTKIKVVGRVVGGAIEKSYPQGFGMSTNNIGNSEIVLKTKKIEPEFDAITKTFTNETNQSLQDSVTSTKVDYGVNKKEIRVYPDTVTGEFIVYLLPEEYTVESVKYGYDVAGLDESIDQNELPSFNLKDAYIWQEFYKTGFDTVQVGFEETELVEVNIDTFKYQYNVDFIVRTDPEISVYNVRGNKNTFYGESVAYFYDETSQITDTISLKTETDAYVFGFPVFNQAEEYGFIVSAYEPYVNLNNYKRDEVPITDGVLRITNYLARNSETQEMELDSTGTVVYTFRAADPNFAVNATDSLSFVRQCEFNLFAGGKPRSGMPLIQGIIVGGMPTGNNFVTVGPKVVDFILRDPPGSGSSTYLEEGISVETTYEYSHGASFGAGVETTFKLGASAKVFAGVGAGTITETEYKSNIVAGLENKNEYVDATTTKSSTKTTTKISTSDSPDYVGADGDVFVGSAVNVVYGRCDNLGLIPMNYNSEAKRIDSAVSNTNKSYTIGKSSGMFLSPSFATTFSYTQKHIEDALIPSLTMLRNTLLRTDITNPDTYENKSDYPIYVSRVLDTEDEKFGSNNNDSTLWQNSASKDLHIGPSYVMILPQNPKDSVYTDSVRHYNAEIRDWIKVLADNEKEKLEAKLRENRSFDAGVTIESSIETCGGKTETETWDVDVNLSGNFETGFEFNKWGLGLKISANVGYKYHQDNTTSRDTCTTWGFTLADGDSEDYYSVDIKEANNSPVFATRGGQSSCPYEGEIVTKYYKPGEVLSFATMKIEDPELTMEPGYESVAKDVSGNLPAVYKIRMNNKSETSSTSWCELIVDEMSNPNGAIIEMDGLAIGTGRVFRLLPYQDIQKTLNIKRGPYQDINDYENIRLILRSQCDSDNADTLLLSAHFLPFCSHIAISEPKNNSVVNTITGDTLDIRLTEFDRSNSKFSHITLQYNNGAGWKSDKSFYNTDAAYNAATDKNNAEMITLSDRINYRFNMHSLPDATYRLRAVSYCYSNGLPTGDLDAVAYSEEITIVKDMLCPTLFGSIQPADGILDIGDDIIVTFNEPIEAGMISKTNFTINGVLNGYDLKHNAGVNFNGTNESVDIPQEMNLIGKPLTVEMWIEPLSAKKSTLFIHGDGTKSFEFGLTAGGQVYINVNGTERISSNVVAKVNEWGHLAVVYNIEENGDYTIAAYWNDIILSFPEKNVPSYEGSGQIKVGSDFTGQNGYHGNMHDLRIWTKALTFGTVYEQMNQSLTGNENKLIGYWPMEEVKGTIAYDKARKRQAIINASWFVLPKGKAISFNGSNQYLDANFVTPIGREQNFSISFWFKGDSATSAGLFSLGHGINDYDKTIDKWSIFIEDNSLYVQNNGAKHLITSVDLLDNRWHHFAFSVKRNANAVVYIDGVKVKDMESNLFGGLTSDKFVLGARKWNTTSFSSTVDMYFDGKMDEFRIWQLALTQKIVELDMNAKLTGTEKGLAAYYPFEKYEEVQGDVQIIGTLADQWINPIENAPNGDTAVWVSGNSSLSVANLSDDAANLKDARPLQDVNYSWVVNEDKINIIINEPMKLIENCIIEFTMDGIYDQHGNYMKSAEKWSTYINRNYLKWSEESIVLQKEVLEELTFTVKAINKSGLEQTYSIENLPAWLTASPSSGTIAPIKEQEIVFTIDPGLNVGIYDENIYLRGESGIDELLVIDLRVLGERPDWNVDPTEYDYSMNIFGELNINGIVSADAEDILAAFVGTECVGVTKLRYIEEYDKYLAFLNVYGDSNVASLSFKIWDASTGMVYVNVMPDTLKFKANSYYGTAKSPIVFRTMNMIEQHIPLKSGWNWISKNVDPPAKKTVNDVFVNNSFDDGDFIKSQFNDHDQYSSNSWKGEISNSGGMKNSQMYMLKVKSDKNLTIIGEPINTDSNKITIYKGWTWIGFTPQINLSVNEAFTGLNPQDGDLVKSQNSFSIYYEGVDWLGSLNYLMPGNGYIYYSTANGEKSFSYPNVSALSSNQKSAVSYAKSVKLDSDNEIERTDYQYNLSMIATLDVDEVLSDDATILCYAGNECRGVGNIIHIPNTDKYLYFITIGGNEEGEMLSFRLKTSGQTISLNEKFTYKTNQLYGTVEKPVVFTLSSSEESSIMAYPIPFTTRLSIAYNLVEADKGTVKFNILDASGRVLSSFEQTHTEAGYYTYSLDGVVNNFATGVYFISMTTNSGKRVVKAVKTK